MKPRPPALTIESFASDCIEVLRLNRVNAFRGVTRDRILLYLSNGTAPQEIPATWTRWRFGGARPGFECPHCASGTPRAVDQNGHAG